MNCFTNRELLGYECRRVESALVDIAKKQILEAYNWCSKFFPLCYLDTENVLSPAITSITVGKSNHESELLSASSFEICN